MQFWQAISDGRAMPALRHFEGLQICFLFISNHTTEAQLEPGFFKNALVLVISMILMIRKSREGCAEEIVGDAQENKLSAVTVLYWICSGRLR